MKFIFVSVACKCCPIVFSFRELVTVYYELYELKNIREQLHEKFGIRDLLLVYLNIREIGISDE